MTNIELQNSISQGEGLTTEFKQSFNRQAVETIVALKTDNYQAQSRNKLVTEAFYLTKDIEKYGSGYRRIREYISEYPTLYFNFEENSGGFLTKIGYKEQKVVEKSDDVPDDIPDNVPDKRLKIILKLIELNNKVLLQEIADKLKVSKRTIRRDIEKLKQQNKLERIGSEKNGYWKITNRA